MQNKKWLILIIFGLCLISLSIIVPIGKSTILFEDLFSKQGTLIHVDGYSYNGNMTLEAYNKDLTTSRLLQIRNSITARDSDYVPFSYNMSPMDSYMFDRNHFKLYCNLFQNLNYVVILVRVTLQNDTDVIRTVNVTATGSYFILNNNEYAKKSNSSYIHDFNAKLSFPRRISYRINQSRWGVISKYDNIYYVKNAFFDIYNLLTYTSDNKVTIKNNIYFDIDKYSNYYPFNIAGNNNISFINCSIIVNDKSSLYNKNKWFIQDSNVVNITNCYFYSNFSNEFNAFYNTKYIIKNSIFKNIDISNGCSKYINNSIFIGNHTSNGFYLYNGTISNCTFSDSYFGILDTSNGQGFNFNDCIFKNIDYLMLPNSATEKIYFINCYSNKWSVSQKYSPNMYSTSNGQFHRSYTFQCFVKNITNSMLQNANIKIYNHTNYLIYSGITDSSGKIPKQVLDYSYWDENYPVNPNYQNPYKINITKSGYKNIEYQLYLNDKINLTIEMLKNKSLSLTISENLHNVTGTHQNYYNENTGWIVYNNYTGNTTLVTLYQFLKNVTGSHVKLLMSTGWKVWANYTSYSNVTCGSTLLTISEKLNFTHGTHNSSYNISTGWTIYNNYTGNVTQDDLDNNYISLMSSLIFDNSQFFLLILIGLWCFFISEYVKFNEVMFAYFQFAICIPLTLLLASITFFISLPLVLFLVFYIPILGLYIILDGVYYKKTGKHYHKK